LFKKQGQGNFPLPLSFPPGSGSFRQTIKTAYFLLYTSKKYQSAVLRAMGMLYEIVLYKIIFTILT